MTVMCWQNNCTFIHGPDQWNHCSDVFKTILFAFSSLCLDCQTLFLSISNSKHKLKGSQCRTNHISFQFSWPSLPQKRDKAKTSQLTEFFIYFIRFFLDSGHFSSYPGCQISSYLITYYFFTHSQMSIDQFLMEVTWLSALQLWPAIPVHVFLFQLLYYYFTSKWSQLINQNIIFIHLSIFIRFVQNHKGSLSIHIWFSNCL